MSEKTVSALAKVVAMESTDLLYLVQNVDTSPTSKSIPLDEFISKLPTDVDLHLNKLDVEPADSTIVIGTKGTIKYHDDYVYIQISDTEVKRAQLYTF